MVNYKHSSALHSTGRFSANCLNNNVRLNFIPISIKKYKGNSAKTVSCIDSLNKMSILLPDVDKIKETIKKEACKINFWLSAQVIKIIIVFKVNNENRRKRKRIGL